ncbi:hypothetical protein chiPu_0031367 [Chiloscyllium punctatum]|uniref:Uncharacterized protein n=1 Tax=Chiloscyllium punctatum TaxID=137246 RepID=A0A401TWN1_CHIPU|nr:hypothetical protein [Chiloscyllium punctatum]
MCMSAGVSKVLRILLGVRTKGARAPFHGPMENLGGSEGVWSSANQSRPLSKCGSWTVSYEAADADLLSLNED